MTIDVTCRCGKVLKVDPRHAGKKGRCKSCGVTLQIPALAAAAVPDAPPLIEPLVVDDEAEALNDAFTGLSTDEDGVVNDDSVRAPLPPLPPPPPIVPVATAPPKPAATGVPVEPWYYRFLNGLAMFIFAVGVGIGTCGLILGFVGLFTAPPDSDLARSGGSVFLTVWSGTLLLSSLLTSAPIMLAVDAARNLRAIRYQR